MRSKLKSVALNALCEQIVASEHNTAPTQSFGIPYVRTPNVKNTRLILDESLRVDEATYKEWTKRIEPKPYDIILCREAPVGDSAMILDNQKVCLGQRTVLIRSNKEKIYPKYLLFLLNSPKVKHELLSNSGGTHVDHLNMKDIRNLKVQINHSYDEQKIIGDFLFNLNSQIHSIENQNKLLEQMAQAIFKSWFVDFDGVTEWDDTELGSIPKSWTIENLHDQCRQIVRGHNTKYVKKSNLINLNQKANRGDYLDDSYFKYLDENSKIPLEKFVCKKDILINSLGEGTLGRIHMFLDDRKNIVIDQHITIVRVNNEKIFPEYLYFFLTYPVHNTRLQNQITGSTKMSMLNISSIRDFTIIVPEKKIQKFFSERVSQLYSKKSSNLKQIRNLLHIRDSSLLKLMSGEIRV